MGVMGRDALVESIAHERFVPAIEREELLEVTWQDAIGVGDRLDTLAFQRPELAGDVGVEVLSGIDSSEAGVEVFEIAIECGLEVENEVGIHADDLLEGRPMWGPTNNMAAPLSGT